jgi:hypothetical protein
MGYFDNIDKIHYDLAQEEEEIGKRKRIKRSLGDGLSSRKQVVNLFWKFNLNKFKGKFWNLVEILRLMEMWPGKGKFWRK